MKLKLTLFTLGLVMLSACATPPTPASLSGVPVVEFGNATPDKGDFILYFPSGKNIPTDVIIDGDIFQQTAKQVMTVKLKRDIYSYKDWMSYDKQNWHFARDKLSMMLDIKIPSYTHPKRGHIKLNLSNKH